MIKLAVILASALALTGCASTCERACVFGFGPGNSVFNSVADRADRDDPCQTNTHSRLTGTRLKADNHQPPDFCKFRGSNRLVITDRYGHRIGTIQPR
jgi:hypothetical protein